MNGTLICDGEDVLVEMSKSCCGTIIRIVGHLTGRRAYARVHGTATVMVTASGHETPSATTSVLAATSIAFRVRRVTGRAVYCGDAPDTGNRVLPLFFRPFTGACPLTNCFDHDLPPGTYPDNGYQLTSCDERVTTMDAPDLHIPARVWWGDRRLRYNVWLAVSGGAASLVCLIIDYIRRGIRLPTMIDVFAQAVATLVFMACANACCFVGPLSEYLVRPGEVARYRRVAFGLGLWCSCALPFLFMFASLTFPLWQTRQ